MDTRGTKYDPLVMYIYIIIRISHYFATNQAEEEALEEEALQHLAAEAIEESEVTSLGLGDQGWGWAKTMGKLGGFSQKWMKLGGSSMDS
jgi:hypothetical protein